MALLHRAELRPTKIELLREWLPSRPWAGGGAAAVERVAAFRFDDPGGEVGIETLLVRAPDGDLLQVPLTYRGAPADGQARYLVGTLEHSVLGRRWVYDGCGDPVYVTALATAILTGGTEAAEMVEVDGELHARTPDASVRGTGTAATVPPLDEVVVEDGDTEAVVRSRGLALVVRRVPGGPRGRADGGDGSDVPRLLGTWTGQAAPLVLASVVDGTHLP